MCTIQFPAYGFCLLFYCLESTFSLPLLNSSGANCWHHLLGTCLSSWSDAELCSHRDRPLCRIPRGVQCIYMPGCAYVFIVKQGRGLQSVRDLHCTTSGQFCGSVSCKSPLVLPPPSFPGPYL